MEKRILEIIDKFSRFNQSELLRGKLASEITEMNMKFIEWLCKEYSLDGQMNAELFEYWFDNIYKK
jgi:hypothetical protein